MRIVAFVGSPIGLDDKELVKLAKRLKKEKVNVDIVSFGEEVYFYLINLKKCFLGKFMFCSLYRLQIMSC